jgi:hypothetical protein
VVLVSARQPQLHVPAIINAVRWGGRAAHRYRGVQDEGGGRDWVRAAGRDLGDGIVLLKREESVGLIEEKGFSTRIGGPEYREGGWPLGGTRLGLSSASHQLVLVHLFACLSGFAGF